MKIKKIIVFWMCIILMIAIMELLSTFNKNIYDLFFHTIGIITWGWLWGKLCTYIQKKIEMEEKEC